MNWYINWIYKYSLTIVYRLYCVIHNHFYRCVQYREFTLGSFYKSSVCFFSSLFEIDIISYFNLAPFRCQILVLFVYIHLSVEGLIQWCTYHRGRTGHCFEAHGSIGSSTAAPTAFFRDHRSQLTAYRFITLPLSFIWSVQVDMGLYTYCRMAKGQNTANQTR